jgi:hypothetical protein
MQKCLDKAIDEFLACDQVDQFNEQLQVYIYSTNSIVRVVVLQWTIRRRCFMSTIKFHDV